MEEFEILGADNMVELGKRFSSKFRGGEMVWLEGDLGSGKTTLVQGVLAGLGYQGIATSPTYTLLEPYDLDKMSVMHMDLYRLKSPRELEMLGLRDFVEDSLCLVEWPERGVGILPTWHWRIHIQTPFADGRRVTLEHHC